MSNMRVVCPIHVKAWFAESYSTTYLFFGITVVDGIEESLCGQSFADFRD